MRTKKLLALVLAVALIMSFAMSASAATLYYSQDFSEYTVPSDMGDDAHMDAAAKIASTNVSTTYDVSAWRQSGKNIVYNRTQALTDTRVEFRVNGDGNKGIRATQYEADDNALTFVPNNSWDGKTNPNETYVISFDADPNVMTSHANLMAIVGYRGNATTPAYNRARIMNTHASYGGLLATTEQYSGNSLGLTAGGDTKRIAQAFKYDTTAGQLKREVAVDGVSNTENIGFELENMTTVEALIFTMHFQSVPAFGKFKMYTISGDFTASLVETETVDPMVKSVKIKFNRPVADTKVTGITMKNGDTPFTGFRIGKVEEVYEESTVYSTVEIEFTKTLPEGATMNIVLPNTVVDEIGTPINCDAEASTKTLSFTTGYYPEVETNITASGLGEGSFSALIGKNTTFTSTFANSSSEALDVITFVGIYNSSNQLIGYTFANTSIAAGATDTLALSSKVEGEGEVKALSFKKFVDMVDNINFSNDDAKID